MINKKEEYSSYHNNNIDILNQVFGNVDLTDKQEASLQWLAATTTNTVENVVSAISKLFVKEQEKEVAQEIDIDTYSIYQLKDIPEMRNYRWVSHENLTEYGLKLDIGNYDLVYTERLHEFDTLNQIYERFNKDHPEDFTGHSLSVSDVVVLHKQGIDTAYYVDSFGFTEIPFMPKKTLLDVVHESNPEQDVIIAVMDKDMDCLEWYLYYNERDYNLYSQYKDSLLKGKHHDFIEEHKNHGSFYTVLGYFLADQVQDHSVAERENGEPYFVNMFEYIKENIATFAKYEFTMDGANKEYLMDIINGKRDVDAYAEDLVDNMEMIYSGHARQSIYVTLLDTLSGGNNYNQLEPYENYLKWVETNVESNYNMIDGIINNEPQDKEASKLDEIKSKGTKTTKCVEDKPLDKEVERER